MPKLFNLPTSIADIWQKVGDVVLRGSVRQRQQIGNLLVAVVGADEVWHLAFPDGQHLGNVVVGPSRRAAADRRDRVVPVLEG